MKCPFCGQENSDNYKFCRFCGQKRPADSQSQVPPILPTMKATEPPAQAPAIPPTMKAAEPQGSNQPIQPTMRAVPGEFPSDVPREVVPPFGQVPYPAPQQTYAMPTSSTDYSEIPQYIPKEGIPTPIAAPKGKATRRPGLVIAILVGILLIIVIAGAVAVILLKPELVPFLRGKNLVVGLPLSDGSANLYLLEEGQETENGTLLVENAILADGRFYAASKGKPDFRLDKDNFNLAGFVPSSNIIYFWHLNGDEIALNRIAVGEENSDELFTGQADWLSGVMINRGKNVVIEQATPDSTLCYVSKDGEAADALGEGDQCLVSSDGSSILTWKIIDDKLTLQGVTIADEEVVELLKDQQGVNELRISGNGALAAFIDTLEDHARVVLLDARNGDELKKSGEADKISNLEFAPYGEILFYTTEGEDGNQKIFVLDKDDSQEVDTAPTIQAQFSRDGDYLVYLRVEEGAQPVLISYKVSDDTRETIRSSESLEFTVLEYPSRVIIKEGNGENLKVLSVPVSGKDPMELYKGDGYELSESRLLPGEKTLFLLLRNLDGLDSLYVTSIDKEDGYFILQNYRYLKLLTCSSNNKKLVFLGRKGTDDLLGLYSINLEEDANPLILDNDIQDVLNAVFARDDKYVYYTVKNGENPEEVEVRKVEVTEDGAPAAEYENAFLADAQWGALEPFQSLIWGEAAVESKVQACSSEADLSVGSIASGSLMSNKKSCYSFQPGAYQVYSIGVDSLVEIDPLLRVVDSDGNVVGEDDDSGPGNDPILVISPTITSTLTLEVWAKSEQEGDYQIRIIEGKFEPAFAQATFLPLGQRLRDTITPESAFTTLTFSQPTYGRIYAITGKSGETIRIDVFARSIGSQVTPKVQVFDPYQVLLKEEDILVTGNQDYSFLYTLNADGRFYILVKDELNRYGSEDKFFYEIIWGDR